MKNFLYITLVVFLSVLNTEASAINKQVEYIPCRTSSIIFSDINTDSRLCLNYSPYIVTQSFFVKNGATLTIEPGVVVKFEFGKGMHVAYYGTLIARGEVNNPILFTSNASTPAPGDWSSLYLTSTASEETIVENVIIEYAGAVTNAGIEVRGPVKVINSIIRNNEGYGMAHSGSRAIVNSNNFMNNTAGGLASGYGIYSSAENIWWGDHSGPSGAGPGTGQAVTSMARYEPWRGEEIDCSFTFYDVSVSPRTFNKNGSSAKIFARITESAQWSVIIRNSNNQMVNAFGDTGTEINVDWSGESLFMNAQSLPDGDYNYIITAESLANPGDIITLIGRITLDNLIPVAKITTPQVFDGISEKAQIEGTASDTYFNSYVLEYGEGYSPSMWTVIATSVTPVINGVLGTWTIPSVNSPRGRIRLTVKRGSTIVSTDEIPVQILP